MSSQPVQARATAFNPDGLDLIKAAGLERVIGASLERVWENVADWEHLPWLHHSSFSSIELQDAAAWGWRAKLGAAGGESVVELVMDKPASQYVARTLEGSLKGMEIWTVLTPVSDHETAIEVSFHVPTMPDDIVERLGAALEASYQTLWDEDEAMMQAREKALSEAADSAAPVVLGHRDDVIAKLPMALHMGGRPIRLERVDGDIVAFRATCPHMLRPLDDCPNIDGTITCPWHGYTFDLRTGASPQTELRLLADFVLQEDEGVLTLKSI
jgi:nitrite reductase/ring-hydroxylating ferredoxin subunit